VPFFEFPDTFAASVVCDGAPLAAFPEGTLV